MSRWYWFIDSVKLIFSNICTKEPVKRSWLISEDKLQYYHTLRDKYKQLQLERDMWHTIAKDLTDKFNEVVWYENQIRRKIK